jgi:hypothetical protein
MACTTGGHAVFIQIMQGTCTRPAELRAHLETWTSELGPGAPGWLGGTFGFTDDDAFVGVVRFESRESAMANSARPEQGEWAATMESLMDGPMEYHDCDDVMPFLDGGSDDAGFVQVIQGKVDDPDRIKAMLADTTRLHEMRPDIIGGTLAIEADGSFTETIAFRDEDSARAGEQQEPPAEVREELESMLVGARFYDLHEPWFVSH